MNNLRAQIQGGKRGMLLRLCAWIFLIGACPQLYAADSGGANAVQQSTSRTIKGEVKDGDGYPIPGAAVMVKGTTSGTVTDFDGNFTLKVKGGNSSIVISFMGYDSKTIEVGTQSVFNVVLESSSINIGEVVAVGYGTQKKETMTGAISSVQTEALVRSPNASVANSLAGQITGLSSIQTSGQPGLEDPTIYIRGVGTLSEGGSKPLILVDGVENSFFQMDPNEIESISVLKDASATAVFGVRGANGVILVTTRRGKDGPAQITINSSVGIQSPTALLDMADSYSFAQASRKMNIRDGLAPSDYSFSDYDLERFRLKDDPLLYPDIDWRKELMNKQSLQTQHNVNVSGGTKKVKYFTSLGFLYQEGLFKKLEGLKYDNNFDYTRFNYRSNVDINVTKTTLLKLGIGGIVGNTQSPNGVSWQHLNYTQPFNSPGVIDGRLYMIDPQRYQGILMDNNIMKNYYGSGYKNEIKNTMNLNLAISQKLDFITKGLKFEVKGAYNTSYKLQKLAEGKQEYSVVYYKSEVNGSNLVRGDDGFDYEHANIIQGENTPLSYKNKIESRTRDWYFETSLRYNRTFGNHSIGGLVLYNQSKKYYPKYYTNTPAGYVGLVGRLTYDYKSKYVAEFNVGYNGSENFAPGNRYGLFPALSLGYVISEEAFMKNQSIISYMKIRGSIGMVGNDKLLINNNAQRFLYLPNAYSLNQGAYHKTFKLYTNGYNFGSNSTFWNKGVAEGKIGNPLASWETAQKTNFGLDVNFLNNRLKFVGELFYDDRKDILINRGTTPSLVGYGGNVPAVNLGRVKNQGYELQLGWNDKVGDFKYNVSANISYAKNEVIFKDEIVPEGYEYIQTTGHEVGAVFGYEFDRLFTENDFNITTAADGTKTYALKAEIPNHKNVKIRPGDAKYKDLSGNGEIDPLDQHYLATSKRPDYTFGLNMGFSYKGIFASMNWTGVTGRTMVLDGPFRELGSEKGNNRNYMKYIIDNSWQEETAGQAMFPRMANGTSSNNKFTSDVWLRDGSYLKLKNVTLGYRFDVDAIGKFGLKGLELKLTGYNLFTFSEFDIMDPESEPNYNDKYPVVKIFNLGATLRF
ncbi:TonB-dependent receptor [Prolixibacteraceae bacterium]|nr:TonB-dependent receptor [Prolixibacteraceae bacterium]